MAITDGENGVMGVIGGSLDVLLLHWTVSAKNNAQQGLPFETHPAVLYRGVVANLLNNSFCVGSQFLLNGMTKQVLLGGSSRQLTAPEKIGAGAAAGAVSGVVCGPIELVMIQQQRHGTGVLSTVLGLGRQGPMTVFRGTPGLMAREGLFCAGYLGFVPVVREYVRRAFPDSLGKTEDSARLAATLIAGPVCSLASHPFDTVKTGLQGDVAGARFRGYAQGVRLLVAQGGLGSLWLGAPWRLFRQLCAVFLFDKVGAELAPLVFPHAFAEPARERPLF